MATFIVVAVLLACLAGWVLFLSARQNRIAEAGLADQDEQ